MCFMVVNKLWSTSQFEVRNNYKLSSEIKSLSFSVGSPKPRALLVFSLTGYDIRYSLGGLGLIWFASDVSCSKREDVEFFIAMSQNESSVLSVVTVD